MSFFWNFMQRLKLIYWLLGACLEASYVWATPAITLIMFIAAENIEFICGLFCDAASRTGYVELK